LAGGEPKGTGPVQTGPPPPGQTHYELLQLPTTATVEELRRAFRTLSKRYHPDTTSLPAAEAEERFRRLKEAYGTLADPLQRQAYDARFRPAAPRPPVPFLRRTEPKPLPVRRALSGGEWFALVLLALALVASLALGVGMAWVRGAEWVHQPSWWPGEAVELEPVAGEAVAGAVQTVPRPGLAAGNDPTA